MSAQRIVQRRLGPGQAPREPADLPHAAGEYLTTRELAAYLGYRGKRAKRGAA